MNFEFLIKHRLNQLIRLLKKEERLPAHLQIASIENVFIATAHNEISGNVMPESVTTGLATSPNLALLKALTEHVERHAYIEGITNGIEACATERSDGIAAFPRVLTLPYHAERQAKINAHAEAIERFVWATWWDNPTIGFRHKVFSVNRSDASAPLFDAIERTTPITKVHLVEPFIASPTKEKVLILIVELRDGGFISGGAAGQDAPSVLFRAASELLRHSIAISRIKNGEALPESFYEKRLAYFGLGDGDNLVRHRLSFSGGESVTLPDLYFDTAIPHSLSSIVAVHRCYFENQPHFVGGELERLCI